MSKLVLDSLEIKNFRAFKHLRIEKLGRVNLIVGKNNVGKSSVLEALWLYGRRGDPAVIWDILGSRAERSNPLSQEAVTVEDRLEALKYLFHGRQDVREHEEPILIGAINPLKPHFFIDVAWFLFQPGENGSTNLKRVQPAELQGGDTSLPGLVTGFGDQIIYTHPLASEMRWSSSIRKEDRGPITVFASARGLSKPQIGHLWDDIALTDLEDDVVTALRIISSGIERASLVAETGTYPQRNPIVKLQGVKTQYPSAAWAKV